MFGVLPGSGGRTPREDPLRQWIRGQRVKASRGELSGDRIQALERVDGDWRVNRSSLSWEDKLTAAALAYQETGQVPGTDVEPGLWLQRQRSRMSAGNLSADQLRALDESVPGWKNLDKLTWSRHARSLAAYVKREGGLPTSRCRDPEGLRLYTWLARQRKSRRNGLLDEGQLAELAGIHPQWRGRNS